jgi:hypothetical protein
VYRHGSLAAKPGTPAAGGEHEGSDGKMVRALLGI